MVMMILRALGGVLLLDCMLYCMLRMLLGRRRRLAGAIALGALFLLLVASAIGLMGVDFTQTFTDEIQVYQAVYHGFVGKANDYIAALTSPEKTLQEALTVVGMLIVLIANLWILLGRCPGMFMDNDNMPQVIRPETLSACMKDMYPVVAVKSTLVWALLMAADMALCIGVHWLLHGTAPW